MGIFVGILPFIIRGAIALIAIKPFIEWFLQRRKFVNTINSIPGFPSYPLIGSLWITFHLEREEIINFALARPKFFPDGISHAWLGPFPEVRVDTAELAQEVLLSKKCFAKARIYDLMIGGWIGNGLVLNTGEKWFKHRRLLTSTFHFDILNKYCVVFQKKADVLCDVLEKYSKSGETFNIAEYFYRLTFDAILETAFGLQLDIQRDNDCAYLRASEEIGEIAVNRVKNPLFLNSFIFKMSPLGRRAKKVLKVLHDFSNKVIKDRREELKERKFNTEEDDICFLNLLLRESQTNTFLTDKDIREEVDTFMFAVRLTPVFINEFISIIYLFKGHDTTATMLSWTILLIGNHPSVQQAIYDEQVTLFGHDKTPPTQKDLPKMQYLERTIKECVCLLFFILF
uniref:CSON006015 protein n=1 Tax=Culicoides sonorensis TaxID=179676 RepID=A0A336LIP2_CULSO